MLCLRKTKCLQNTLWLFWVSANRLIVVIKLEDTLLEEKGEPPLHVSMKEGGEDWVVPEGNYDHIEEIPCKIFGGEVIPPCSNEVGRGGMCWSMGKLRTYRWFPYNFFVLKPSIHVEMK